jgi:hypothetical protein
MLLGIAEYLREPALAKVFIKMASCSKYQIQDVAKLGKFASRKLLLFG